MDIDDYTLWMETANRPIGHASPHHRKFLLPLPTTTAAQQLAL
jgi:hypothetical protein